MERKEKRKENGAVSMAENRTVAKNRAVNRGSEEHNSEAGTNRTKPKPANGQQEETVNKAENKAENRSANRAVSRAVTRAVTREGKGTGTRESEYGRE